MNAVNGPLGKIKVCKHKAYICLSTLTQDVPLDSISFQNLDFSSLIKDQISSVKVLLGVFNNNNYVELWFMSSNPRSHLEKITLPYCYGWNNHTGLYF